MARPRLFVPGLSHHVRHRGNNRCNVFRSRDDRQTFLQMFREAAVDYEVAIHGYALMTTHYHAQVTPLEQTSLPRMMQCLGRRYVRYFNDRHRRTGTLWEGRYRASLILDERYWFDCLRYVEINPVRAGIVKAPGDYEWSSYRGNACGVEDPLLTSHALYLALGAEPRTRAQCWSERCGQPLSEADTSRIRDALRHNKPLHMEDE